MNPVIKEQFNKEIIGNPYDCPVLCLFLLLQWVGLSSVIAAFPGHTCNMYDVCLFNMLFTKFLLTKIFEILMVNKLL